MTKTRTVTILKDWGKGESYKLPRKAMTALRPWLYYCRTRDVWLETHGESEAFMQALFTTLATTETTR